MMASNYLDSILTKRANEVLTGVADLLVNDSKDDKEYRQKRADLADKVKGIQLNLDSPEDTFRKYLKNLWLNIKIPDTTILSCISKHRQKVLNSNQDSKRGEILTTASYAAQGQVAPGRYSTDQAHFLSDPSFVQIGEAFFPISENGEQEPQVLVNPLTFTYEDIKHLIVRTPSSNHLHVLKTIENILIHGQELGFPLKTYLNVFRSFVKNELKEHSGTFEYITDATQFFNTLCEIANYEGLSKDCLEQMKRISRGFNEKGVPDSILNVIGLYKSLHTERLFLLHPQIELSKQEHKINREAIKQIKNFVEQNMADQIDVFMEQYYNNFNKKAELHDVLKFVQKTEQDPEYKLKTPKSLSNKVINVSVYNSEMVRVRPDEVSQHFFQDVESHLGQYDGYTDRSQVRTSPYDFRSSANVRSHYMNNSTYPGRGNVSNLGFNPERRGYVNHQGNYSQNNQGTPYPSFSSSHSSDQSNSRPNQSATPPPPPPRSPSPAPPSAPLPNRPPNTLDRSSTNRPASPIYQRTPSGQFRVIDRKNVYSKSPNSGRMVRRSFSKSPARANNEFRGRSSDRKKCVMCGSYSHSKPLPKGVYSKDPKQDCIYRYYPQQKYDCSKCGKGKHSSQVCLSTHGVSRPTTPTRSASSSPHNSRSGKPSFSAANPHLNPNQPKNQ